MVSIAVASNMLLGYVEHQIRAVLLAIMPIVVSISFFLIAEIDSPRFGVIRVLPQNLLALAESIKPH